MSRTTSVNNRTRSILSGYVFPLLFAVCCAASAQAIQAATITVTNTADTTAADGQCTLREAIGNANADNQSGSIDCAAGSGADTINLPAGTINLLSALPNLTSDLTLSGVGQSQTTVRRDSNAATEFRIFNKTGGTATIRLMTISDGTARQTANETDTGGGGIYNIAGSLTLDGVTLSNNRSIGLDNANGIGGYARGGAIRSLGNLTVTNSLITGNSATGGNGTTEGGGANGGGIRIDANLTLTNSTISNNIVLGGNGSAGIGGDGYGGGIATVGEGIINISGSTFSGNSITAGNSAMPSQMFTASSLGGGIYALGTNSTLTITTTTVTGNSVTGSAYATSFGGFAQAGGVFSIKNTTVTDSSITNNAVNGGASSNGQGGVGQGGGIVLDNIATLTNVTVSGNTARAGAGSNAQGGFAYGGGLLCNDNGQVTLNNLRITGNRVIGGNSSNGRGGEVYGGGVYGGRIVDNNSIISGNSAIGGNGSTGGGVLVGGGIYLTGGRNNAVFTSTFNGTVISENTGVTGSPATPNINAVGGGVGILDKVVANFNSVKVINNTVTAGAGGLAYGGGMFNQNGDLRVNNSLVSNNRALGNGTNSFGVGGGVFSVSLPTVAFLTINGSTIANNTANLNVGGVGAIGVSSITRSTISGNATISAIGQPNAGGIGARGQLSLTGVTITNNSAAGNAAAGGILINSGATVDVRDTIIAGNVNSSTAPDVLIDTANGGGTFTSGGYNLIGNPGSVTAFNQTGDQVGTAGSPLDPQLLPLAFYGGQTPTHALRLTSPALDKSNSFGATTDQRGFPQPFDFPNVNNAPGGDGSDIGSFERQNAETGGQRMFDFDGDSKTDLSVFRPSNGTWYFQNSSNGQVRTIQFGLANDKIAPADYDGDGKADIAVFRDGVWYILQSLTNQVRYVTFGAAGDLPRPGDFDGDGIADISVFRPSNGTWYRISSRTGQTSGISWGTIGDVPMIGDYDGDGKTDTTVYRPSDTRWYILRSSDNQVNIFQLGATGDTPVMGDFNGDGRSDLAVYRPTGGTWIYASAQGTPAQTQTTVQFGAASDVPVAADYDGDGKTDIAVYRSGVWYILRSTDGQVGYGYFGLNTDKPIPAAYLP